MDKTNSKIFFCSKKTQKNNKKNQQNSKKKFLIFCNSFHYFSVFFGAKQKIPKQINLKLEGMATLILLLLICIPILILIIAFVGWWKQDLIIYTNYFPTDSIGSYTYLPTLYSLKYEDVWLKTEDGVLINAWFIHAPNENDPVYGRFFQQEEGLGLISFPKFKKSQFLSKRFRFRFNG